MALTPAVRAAAKSVDAELILTDVTSMAALVDVALGGAPLRMQILSGFALIALLMAALGIYGVVAFVVSRRTREVGIRMALGARAGDVLGLVLEARHGAGAGRPRRRPWLRARPGAVWARACCSRYRPTT
jgi:hypothetical protein